MGQLRKAQQLPEDGASVGPAFLAGVLRRLFGDSAADLVVNSQEGLRVRLVMGQVDDVPDVRHDPVGEKGVVHPAAAIGYPAPGQQVDQRQGAVVVAVKHRRLLLDVGRHIHQPGVLVGPVHGVDHPDGSAGGPGGVDGLGAAVVVFPDEGVRRPENFRRGAVVFLHQQHPDPGIGLLKLHQGIRIGGPEAIDALVLVAYHEDVAAFPGQQADDGVLDPGGVLGFVHADIGEAVLKMGPHILVELQDFFGVHHLVVIVHPFIVPQGLAVFPVQLREFLKAGVQLPQPLLRQHHIFGIGDALAQLLHHALGGVLAAQVPVQVRNQLRQGALVLRQDEGRPFAAILGIVGDDLGGHAVDGADLRGMGAVLAEQGGKALLHLPGGSPGIGHGENLVRRNAAAAQHIAQAGHQHGGFPAAGHRQQQHRALHGVHRLLLLAVQPGGIFPVKGFPVHGAPPLSFMVRHAFYHKSEGFTIGSRPAAGTGFLPAGEENACNPPGNVYNR